MGFETASKENALTREEIIAGASKKADNFLMGNRINLKDFCGHYGDIQIQEDNAVVAGLKQKFDGQNTEQERELGREAKIAEAIIGEQGELSEWLGSSVELFNTSEFDDFVNGIDLIAEYEIGEMAKSHLGLGVDVVMSSDMGRIGDKIEKIRGEIENGKSGTIKYFQSSDGSFKGRLANIPKVIIGINRETNEKLAELWLQETKVSKDELAKHWVQFQILDSILMQLESFGDYAEKVGQTKIAESYRRASKIITEVYEERRNVANDSSERDNFFNNLSECLDKVLHN